MDADVIVVGAGLSGLVAAAEIADAGRRVLVVDQESAANLGGQAHWSFGGLFLVDSPEQRRMGIKDTVDLAWQDWQGSAGFDRLDDEDKWGVQWARAYVDFAAGEKRSWLHEQGMRFFPVVGWAERGDGSASGHGNSVPRFHIVWGTGPGVLAPFLRRVAEHVAGGRVEIRHRHQVDQLVTSDGSSTLPVTPSTTPPVTVSSSTRCRKRNSTRPFAAASRTRRSNGATRPGPVPQVMWKRGTELPWPDAEPSPRSAHPTTGKNRMPCACSQARFSPAAKST